MVSSDLTLIKSLTKIMHLLSPSVVSRLGQDLIKMRQRLKLSQHQFDVLLGLHPGTVNRYEARDYDQCSLAKLNKFYAIAYAKLEKNIRQKYNKSVDDTAKV